MKLKMVFGILLLFLVAVFSSAQQSEDLSVKAGTKPGNLLYGLDRAMERVQLALARDPEKKAELHLFHAEERLAELKELVEQNRFRYVERLAKDHDDSVEKAEEEIGKAVALGRNTTALSAHVAEMTYKHILVLERVLEKVPEQARESIQRAINASINGNQRAVMSIEKETGKSAEVPKVTSQMANEIRQRTSVEQRSNVTAAAGKGEGKLKVQITDKPGVLNITKLEVTISSVKIHSSTEGFEGETCENESYVDEYCEEKEKVVGRNCTNITEPRRVCTNTTEIVERCTNITEVQEVCVNQTLYREVCAEDVCEGGEFVNEECTGTLVPGECINESYVEPVCSNESIVTGQECVNETVITGENCVNESVVVRENCVNVTEVEEECSDVVKMRTICTGIGDGGAGWHEIINTSKTFDLVKLRGVKDFLGETTLGAGVYQQVRLAVSSARIWVDGVEYDLKIPSGSVKLIKPFTIEAGKTTTLTLDFDAEKSVHQTGKQQFIMRPTIKLIVE